MINKFENWINEVLEIRTREDWSIDLSVSKAAISQWSKFKTIPSENVLKSILFYLREFDEDKLLDKFNNIKYEKIESISINHKKFKGCNSLNDYLLRNKINQLKYKISKSNEKIKECQINSLLSVVSSSNSNLLTDKLSCKILDEYNELSSNLSARLRTTTAKDEKHIVANKVIQELRKVSNWLENLKNRPVPKESKVWLKQTLINEVKERNGLVEVYNTGMVKKSGNSNQEQTLPLMRIYSIDFSLFDESEIILKDILQTIIVLPFSGSCELNYELNSSYYETSERKPLIINSDDNDILPPVKISSTNMKCHIVLYSIGGVHQIDSLSTLYRKRERFSVSLNIQKSTTGIHDMINSFSDLGVPDTIEEDIHKNNRKQKILETFRITSQLFENLESCDSLDWKFSLVKFNFLDETDKIETLYKHEGYELIIPLNDVKFKVVKCGVKVSESTKYEFNRIKEIDRYHDVYDIQEGGDQNSFLPLIILDSEIPHAFQAIEKGKSSLCLHIFLRPNVNSIINDNENMDKTFHREGQAVLAELKSLR